MNQLSKAASLLRFSAATLATRAAQATQAGGRRGQARRRRRPRSHPYPAVLTPAAPLIL